MAVPRAGLPTPPTPPTEQGSSTSQPRRAARRVLKPCVVDSELHIAANAQDLSMLRELIYRQEPLDEKDQNGSTPLHIAIQKDNIECAKALIDAGADLTCKNDTGLSAFDIALQNPESACFELLFYHAVENDEADYLPKFIEKDPSCVTRTSEDGETPLHIAAGNGSINAVKILLEAGANPTLQNEYEESPIYFATTAGNADCLRELILHSPESVHIPDNDGETPLHKATSWKNLDCVQVLLEAGADPSRRNKAGESSIDLSIGSEILGLYAERFPYLLNSPNNEGQTPIHIASEKHLDSDAAAVKVLLEAGALPTLRNREGETAFHIATREKCLKTLEILLDESRPEAAHTQNGHGETPLHKALTLNNPKAFKLLVNKNKHLLLIPNSEGQTPLQILSQERHPALTVALSSDPSMLEGLPIPEDIQKNPGHLEGILPTRRIESKQTDQTSDA